MENRALVVADYFKLRIMLNRTSLIPDQKTEIAFEVLKNEHFGFRLVATLNGVNSPKYIELCKTTREGHWVPSEYSGLLYLEEFCSAYLKRHSTSNDTLEVRRSVVLGLRNELRSLGISR